VTKNAKTVAVVAIGAVLALVLVFVARDVWLHTQPIVHCSDGSHPTIDIRDFTTQYWAYSVKLEATVADKAKASTELDPKLLAQLSEAVQEANEFRKYVVAGYNSCAITPVQYAQLSERFRTLDSLAREIDSLVSRPSLSSGENKKLAGLISQYGDLAKQGGSQ
jgi:hypothetical protein